MPEKYTLYPFMATMHTSNLLLLLFMCVCDLSTYNLGFIARSMYILIICIRDTVHIGMWDVGIWCIAAKVEGYAYNKPCTLKLEQLTASYVNTYFAIRLRCET